jgi:hypothetical protein
MITDVVGVSFPLVICWRRRFLADWLRKPHDAPRAVRPRAHSEDKIVQWWQTERQDPQAEAIRWSVWRASAATWIGESTVPRYRATCQT